MFLDNLINNLHGSLYLHSDALGYLKNRGLSDNEIKEFKLGYSKTIFVKGDGSEEYNIFCKETFRGKAFENKITFPLNDLLNNPAGLMGRSIESKGFSFFLTQESKYLGAFFGLSQSLPHIYNTGRVFTVEGPFDYFAFRRVFPNVVSTLTAELTEAQYEFLTFFVDEIITVFDSDKAGMQATERIKRRWPEKWDKRRFKAISLGYKDPDGVAKYFNDLNEYSRHIKRKVNEVLWK